MLHTSIVERMKSVLIQNAMYRSAGDIYLLGNFSYTPSSILFNDIQYCLFISQGLCGSRTSGNFISIRQKFPCFSSPSKYSQNYFVIRRRSVRKTIREHSCCLPSVLSAFSKDNNQHLNIIGS
ncbi:hypothetical protein MTP99_015834 [Tenebrio molitor]|nr:hypothetical protein MTP99_015834 [Tenebrio molitor]